MFQAKLMQNAQPATSWKKHKDKDTWWFYEDPGWRAQQVTKKIRLNLPLDLSSAKANARSQCAMLERKTAPWFGHSIQVNFVIRWGTEIPCQMCTICSWYPSPKIVWLEFNSSVVFLEDTCSVLFASSPCGIRGTKRGAGILCRVFRLFHGALTHMQASAVTLVAM